MNDIFEQAAIELGEQLLDHPYLLSDERKLKNIVGDFVQDADLRFALKLLVEFGYVKKLVQTDSQGKLVKIAEDNVKKLIKKNSVEPETAYMAVNFWYKTVKLDRNDILQEPNVNTQAGYSSLSQTYNTTQYNTSYQPENTLPTTKKKRSKKWLFLLVLIGVCFGIYNWYQSKKGTLSINIANGIVYVNEKKVGLSPCEIGFVRGKYKVKVVSGNNYWKGLVVIKPGEISKPLGDMTNLPKSKQRKQIRKRTISRKPKKQVQQQKNNTINKPSGPNQTKPSEAELQRAHIDRIMQQMQNNSDLQPVENRRKTMSVQNEQQNSKPQASEETKEAARRRREENLRRIQQNY